MRIALFGATGMIGSRILDEALSRGHELTAIARNPSSISAPREGLTVVAGNIMDPSEVAALTSGHDAVVSAFGPGEQQSPDTLVAAAQSLIAGLERSDVKRLVIVGGAGSLEVAPGVQLVDTPEFPAGWKEVALKHRDALNIIRAKGAGLDWTYISPAAFIHPGERTGKYRKGADQLLTDASGKSEISAEDYAVALLDELEHPSTIRGRIGVGY